MGKSFLVVSLMGLWLVGVCCRVAPAVAGSGHTVSVSRDFKGFDTIQVGSAFEVELVRGEAYAVDFTLDDNLVQYLQARQVGTTVEIGLQPARRYSISDQHLKVRLTLPALAGLKLSGACQGSVVGFSSSSDLDLELSGASSLSGELGAGRLQADLSGASHLTLRGMVRELQLDASGASEARLGGLATTDARVELSGASEASVSPRGRLDAQASGASDLQYSGDPTLGTVQSSGASSIRRI
jgi:hypothetical protein